MVLFYRKSTVCLKYFGQDCLCKQYFASNLPPGLFKFDLFNNFGNFKGFNAGFGIRKTRVCDNRMPRHESQRLQTCERSHASHQVGVWWHAMNIFTAKEIRERLEKMFFTFILRFHKTRDHLKRLQNGFYELNIVCSDQICIK